MLAATLLLSPVNHAYASESPGHDADARGRPIAQINSYDGGEASKAVDPAAWRQMYHKLRPASREEPPWPQLEDLWARAGRRIGDGEIPLAVLNVICNTNMPDALIHGSLSGTEDRLAVEDGECSPDGRVFAISALKDYTHRGRSALFCLDSGFYFTNDPAAVTRIEIDFDDGVGFREVGLDCRYEITYDVTGPKVIKARMMLDDGTVLFAGSRFRVEHLQTPSPHDTIGVVASVPYNGDFGMGEAYVYLSDVHSSLTDPVIVIEGFDIDNTMNWEELYHLLNQEGLVDTLRGRGYDAVVLNFTDATDYIQRNAFVVTELIGHVNSLIGTQRDLAIVGASMGGLVGRYALAYMETSGVNHNVRTFISFDSPQTGANIPLGVQYWVKFFSIESADAALMLAGLDTPAARQMLVYHYTDPPGTTGESDPLRATLVADLVAVGDYPDGLRKVAVANGSGSGLNQGFEPGDQLILYEYNSLLVDIVGNVWAVPDGANDMIFDGLLDRIWPLPDDEMTVYVSGTQPYDGAPGGWRSSMAQMDSSEAPYGDIIALHDNHCFIPTISALALDTQDLFYDIAGDPDLLVHTPFDTVYYPVENQEHILITPESAVWFVDEIERGHLASVAGPVTSGGGLLLAPNRPNPFANTTCIRFHVPGGRPVKLEVFSIRGRLVASLLEGMVRAGWSEVTWDGRDEYGNKVAPGLYVCRIGSGDATCARNLVLIR
jgi:hypothetical protein